MSRSSVEGNKRNRSPRRFELLYDANKAYNEKMTLRRYEVNAEVMQECSFKPELSKYNSKFYKARTAEEP